MALSQDKQRQKMKMLMMLSALFLLPMLAMADRVPMEQQGHPDKHDCVYPFFVQTGRFGLEEKDSVISVKLFDKEDNEILIPDLKKIGLMGHGWHYFQSENLDLFAGKETCLKSTPCRIALTLQSGEHSRRWSCTSVQVTKSEYMKDSTTHLFSVNHTLTTDDPTYIVDDCLLKSSIVTESN